ncbi:hypothetical protein CBS147320_1044 [Aspergillus niger]|nr:hypothetical protein CBS147320_1044 [Aspergillus niger]
MNRVKLSCVQFDRHLLPLLCVLYILSYLDRGNIGNAKIAGLQESLHLNDSDWSWVLNSFYLCYTVFEWTNLLWRLFPAHYYVAVLCICWGAAAMCSGAVHYLGELIVCRCLLGIFEASFGAGAPYFLSLFYQRHELGLRVSVLLGMSPIANCFASALAYGITQIRKGLEPWQYLFLIEGAPTVIISIVVFFFLPDSPGSAWFLDDQQQRDAVGRLTAQDRTAKDRVHWKQVWSGLLDYKNYVHMIIHFCCNYSFAGLSNFLPTLIDDMGYVSVHAQGLTAPPYLGSFVCCLAAAFLSDRLGNRGLVVVGFSTIGLVGYLMLACVHDANADGSGTHTNETRKDDNLRVDNNLHLEQINTGNELSPSMLETVVSNEQDAMRLLFKAAAQSQPSIGVAAPQCSSIEDNESNYPDALRVWNACRFVRMGWFTAQEAISLIEWFFTHLSPLSPILTDFYATISNQFWLVTQEPFLCCTILLLASRYHILPGRAGRVRSSFIHHRLSQHCQHLLLRVMLGQEKISKAKTRTLGTIEALLLLCEWYPKSLHFPPESDGWDSDLILTNPDVRDPQLDSEHEPSVSVQWQQEVIEPTKRLERMSWMILSAAVALAHELGVFKDNSTLALAENQNRSDSRIYLENLELRRQRLPCLLLIFSNIASTRIGCDSLISLGSSSPSSLLTADAKWWTPMELWVCLMHIFRSITSSYAAILREARADASVSSLINEKSQELSKWRSSFEAINVEQQSFNDTLFIDYQHVYTILNSIGMQHRLDHQSSQDNAAPCGYTDAVLDGCTQILNRISSLSRRGLLQYMPVRLFFRMASSSIFLLKALALGTTRVRHCQALEALESTIAKLQEVLAEDELHLGGRYAKLLEILVTRLRKSLLDASPFDESPRTAQGNGTSSQHYMGDPNTEALPIRTDSTSPAVQGLDYDGLDLLSDDQWLSLPFDSSMAPFGSLIGDLGVMPDTIDTELDFLWNLPP